MSTPDAPTPNVPLRMELTFELSASPDRVWDAVATANGISSWFLPTDVEEREGGAICFHMGETESRGTVTGWEPTHRIVYEEPDWADLSGHPGAPVTPMVTEFLVEAQSGGTSVLRVVSSAFGTGADWEQEFFTEMEKHWVPFFDNLRLYLSQFPGQQVTVMSVDGPVPGATDAAYAAVRAALGADGAGASVKTRGWTGTVQRVNLAPGPNELLVKVDAPAPGLLGFFVFDDGEGTTRVSIEGRLFSDDAPAIVEREAPAWKQWIENLAVPAA
jgi:uncharacterized protein YndB with AHSA1/START domain